MRSFCAKANSGVAPEPRAGRSVGEASAWGQAVLTEAGIEDPRLDAELLLAHALAFQRPQLYVHRDKELAFGDSALYAELVKRRACREPLAYLLGYREFYGIDFSVDSRVLVPRPETEILLEQALVESRRLSARLGRLSVVDVGTGCGAIAIVLALNLESADVYATDSSAPALEIAAQNCRRHSVQARVHLLKGDLLLPLPEPVDLVVANLPYIGSEEISGLSPEIRCFEPRQAWYGGRGGLESIERLLAQVHHGLNDGGSIVLEVGAAQASVVESISAEYFPAARVEVMRDLRGLDRVVRVADIRVDTHKDSNHNIV
jgi:release factor glutamine methyltransferase